METVMARLVVLFAVLAGVVAATVAAVRHRGPAPGHHVPGGILMGQPGLYDKLTGILMGSLIRGIAADVAAGIPASTRVLDVGCGPGHLSIRLADLGLEVTGLDLDPAMIERAQANATEADGIIRPSFVVGDASALPFPDASFDVAVSTFSVHHWAEPATGLAEIGRVLRPGGRALIWDVKPDGVPLPDRAQTRGYSEPAGACPRHIAAADWSDAVALAVAVRTGPTDRAGPRPRCGTGDYSSRSLSVPAESPNPPAWT